MAESIGAYIGRGTRFEGSLKFNGIFRVEGYIKGEIEGDGFLIIGKQARIIANLRASKVIVYGKVKGDIVASDKIEIRIPAKIDGNIKAPAVAMEEGIELSGSCTILKKSESDGNMFPDEELLPISSCTVSGMVLHPETQKPLDGVKVKLYGVEGKVKTETNNNGFFIFTGIKSGEWTIEVKCRETGKREEKIFLSEGKRFDITF